MKISVIGTGLIGSALGRASAGRYRPEWPEACSRPSVLLQTAAMCRIVGGLNLVVWEDPAVI